MTEDGTPRVVDFRTLPPDPSLTAAVGLHHSLHTAVADLVDNSIDAGAGNVLVRFLQRDRKAVGLQIVDDGAGMDDRAIDAAMTYARKRDYEDGELGHFGLGMKAASLSQADTLVVRSRARGRTPVGRLLDRDAIRTDHRVSVLDADEAAEHLDGCKAGFPIRTGTIVEWRDVRTFLNSSDLEEQTSWLEDALDDTRTHLGVVLHRILGSGKVRITLDVFDTELGEPGVPRTVEPVDPFGYQRSGSPEYPRTLRVDLPGRSEPLLVEAHIWPPKSSQAEYRLFGVPGRKRQGFYFYRHDRLLQIGGWNGVVNDRPDYELGRVSIDIDDDLQRFVTINPEKSSLVLDSTLAHAIEAASFVDGDGGFPEYLEQLCDDSRKARSRQPKPVSVVEPRSGLPAEVLEAFDEALTFRDDEPVHIKWRTLPRGTFFEVDRERRHLRINARYRTELVGHRSLDPQDAPVLKTLLHLVVSEMFEGAHDGPADKRKKEAWQTVLAAALQAQIEQHRARNDDSGE